MFTVFLVVVVAFGLAGAGGYATWRTTAEIRASVAEWFEDVAKPFLSPPVVLSVPRLQRRSVRTVLSEVVVTGSGRGILGSPVSLYYSPGDYDRLEHVLGLLEAELAADLTDAAKSKSWLLPVPVIVEIFCDPSISDGHPEAELGVAPRDSVRKMTETSDQATPLVRYVDGRGIVWTKDQPQDTTQGYPTEE